MWQGDATMWGVACIGPPCGGPAQVPGVLGMIVLHKCYHELFGQHATTLFSQPCISEGPEPVMPALQQCHRATVTALRDSPGRAKVIGKRAWWTPSPFTGVMKIAATCSEQFSGTSVLFEPLNSGLPVGLLASPVLVWVIKGKAYILVVNVGVVDVMFVLSLEH